MHSTSVKKILFLAANPSDLSHLRLDKELKQIEEGLRRATNRNQFELVKKWAVTPLDVQRSILDFTPHIVHFSGHGLGAEICENSVQEKRDISISPECQRKPEGLIFEDDTGQAKLVDTQAIEGLFKLFSSEIECVVLNACYSENQAEVIAKHIPYVIGMNRKIGDAAAIAFAVGFYDALGAGRDICFAYESGCVAIELTGIPEEHIPVLKRQIERLNPEQPEVLSTVEFKTNKSETKSINYHCQNISNSIMDTESSIMISTNSALKLSDNFDKHLKDFDIQFALRNREQVYLDDLFVFPDLKKQCLSKEQNNIISSKKIFDLETRIIVYGDEQSGKTSLAKKIFLESLSRNFSPVYLSGSKFKTSNIESLVKDAIFSSYLEINPEEFLSRNNLICIIDDAFANRLNTTSRKSLIAELNHRFSRTIFLSEISYQYIKPEYAILDEYAEYEILPFGHVNRSQLIKRWIELDYTEETSENEILTKCDTLRIHIDSLVRKNIVPAKPLYILMFLQSFDAVSPRRQELTSYGHCYQYLIYQHLEKAKVKSDKIDTYYNFLTEFGGAIFDTSDDFFDDTKLDDFMRKYSTKYLSIDKDKILSDLKKASILVDSDKGIRFRYRYLFYFFASKKLSDNLSRNDSARQVIKKLVSKIHLEKASNIILFLTHHSKDPWVLEEILLSVMEIFVEEKVVTLEAHTLSFLQEFVKEIPELILEKRDANEERLAIDRNRDNYEIEQEKHDDTKEVNDGNNDEIVVKVTKLFRSIEVCGQILRARIGSLERDSLELLYEESVLVSLRFLGLFLKFTEYVKEESIRKISLTIEENPKHSDTRIQKEVKEFYLGVNYYVILSMLNKVSYSIGTSNANEIFSNVTKKINMPAFDLIQQIIDLQFDKDLNFKNIEKLYKDFDRNPVCIRLLKHIVLQYCYTHDIGFKDRQKLADILKMNIQPNTPRKSLQ